MGRSLDRSSRGRETQGPIGCPSQHVYQTSSLRLSHVQYIECCFPLCSISALGRERVCHFLRQQSTPPLQHGASKQVIARLQLDLCLFVGNNLIMQICPSDQSLRKVFRQHSGLNPITPVFAVTKPSAYDAGCFFLWFSQLYHLQHVCHKQASVYILRCLRILGGVCSLEVSPTQILILVLSLDTDIRYHLFFSVQRFYFALYFSSCSSNTDKDTFSQRTHSEDDSASYLHGFHSARGLSCL